MDDPSLAEVVVLDPLYDRVKIVGSSILWQVPSVYNTDMQVASVHEGELGGHDSSLPQDAAECGSCTLVLVCTGAL